VCSSDLLVEDIRVNQVVALRMFKALGYDADVVDSGQRALAALQHRSYDIIFMDIQMPVMDGLVATTQIRQQSLTPRPWIVAMTAYATPGDRERCLASGMDDYISKPISVEAIATTLNNFWTLQPRALLSTPPLEPVRSSATALIPLPAVDGQPPTLNDQVLQYLRSIAEDEGDGLLAEIVESYSEDAPQRLRSIATAIDNADAIALAQAAHALRSLSASMGAVYLSQLCDAMETLGRLKTLDQAHSLFAALEAESGQVIAALYPYLRR